MPSGSITNTPGRVLSAETITLSKLNDLGNPTSRLDEGSVTERELADGAFTEEKFADATLTPAKFDASGLADGNYLLTVASGVASWALQALSSQLPIGGGFFWFSDTLPSANFLFLQGQTLVRASYAAEFVAIFAALDGGEGDGVTSFVLPNMRRRMPYGKDTGDALGDTGGAETHTLAVTEIPAHSHDKTVTRGNDDNTTGSKIQSSDTTSGTVEIDTAAAGGGQAHNNLPPFMYVNFCVRIA